MIIPINDEYRINSDRYQWIVQKLSNKGEWRNQSYHRDLPQLVESLGYRMARDSNADTLPKVLDEFKSIRSTLQRALAPLFKIGEAA